MPVNSDILPLGPFLLVLGTGAWMVSEGPLTRGPTCLSPKLFLCLPPLPCAFTFAQSPFLLKAFVAGGRGRVGGPMRSLIGPCTHLTGVYWAPGPGPGAGGTAENRTDV